MGLEPAAVTKASDIAPAWNGGFLGIHVTMRFRFALGRVRDIQSFLSSL